MPTKFKWNFREISIMPVTYPRTGAGIVPMPRSITEGVEGEFEPGEAVNAHPFEWEAILDFTVPLGSGTGVFYGIIFQLPKWGYKRVKIDESIEVSPVFKQYFDLTIGQKQAMENQIKQGLASIATAISDLELVKHDLRKYKEFMDYFAMIKYGNELIKKGNKEAGEKWRARGDELLKAVFIDQVDVHTGEGIALKLIAPRWPTIITDFLKLTDEDLDPKTITKKTELHGVTEAEAVVLATKNKLYVEWRDRLFKPTVEDRFESLVSLVAARKKSVKEYKEMVKPIIARHRTIKEKAPEASFLQQSPWFMQGAQAASQDSVRIWAWKPFAPTEKYKITREYFDEIKPEEAGFRKSEIKEIKDKLKEKYENKNITEVSDDMFLNRYRVEALPAEPSIDNVVRRLVKLIQNEYKVKITPFELFKARSALVEQFRLSARGASEGEGWVYSPYFIFVDIPMYRTVLKLPNGQEFEDVWIQPLTAATRTQNLIVAHELELIARDMQLDNYIDQLLGERGVLSTGEEASLKELVEAEEFKPPEILEEEKKKMKPEKNKLGVSSEEKLRHFEIFDSISKFFAKTGIGPLQFFTSRGPYEWNINHRLAKIYQPEAAGAAKLVADYFRLNFGVPGVKI